MIEVRVDDLAFVEADAVARPATATLGAPTALVRRLEIAAGVELSRQLDLVEPLPIGAAIVTSAGDLAAELMIHAVVVSDEEAVSLAGVRRATTSVLQRAADWRIAHLAIAPFGLGAGNLDAEGSADAMLDVLAAHAARFPARITVVAENELEAEAFVRRIGWRAA